MAAPVTMTVDVQGTLPRSVVRAAEAFPGEIDQYGGGMEMEVVNPGQYRHHGQTLVPQDQYATPGERCSCCPYGYHIDLDFLRYCESLNNGSYLRNLKKIKKNKRKLRKSMEVFLNGQHHPEGGPPPPDVVHSTETFMNYFEHEDIADRHLLDEIDSTVDNIDLLNHPRPRGYKGSGDYDEPDLYHDDYDSVSPSGNYPHSHGHPSFHDPKYRTETEMVLHQPHKTESVSSLTDTVSEPGSQLSSGDGYRTTVVETEKRYKTQTHTYITAAQLAGQFAELMPEQKVPALESAPESSITPEALKAIREQMATSLYRLRELEEQVKIIPVLQVRLSVLKEENRLHELQLQARNTKLNMRSVGVGDCRIDDYYGSHTTSPSTAMFEMTEFQSFNQRNMRHPSRSIGCGDGNVFEQQQVAIRQQQAWQDNRVHERELHTEESSHIMEREKEVHTLVIGQEQNRLASIKRGELRIPTRSIGVGSNNVFDTSGSVHVHEKEMRTVIIGDADRQKKQHRNVGVSCRATMRDVGVMYYYEDVKPATRNVAVGVGEGLMVGELAENGGDEHTSVHQTLTSLQQINMAAFHSRNINIKSEHLRIILDQMLKKNVKSVGTTCKMATEDKAVNHVGYNMVSIGCGGDTIDVDVKLKVATRSIGVENRPAVMNRGIITDSPRMIDVGANTKRIQIVHRATNTQGITSSPAMTNTDTVRTFSVLTETDNKIFLALDQLHSTGTNTNKVDTTNSETNTDFVGRNLNTHSFNTDITFADKGINTTTIKHTSNRSVNTDKPRVCNMGVGDHSINQHVDCDICLVKPATKTTTTEQRVTEQHIQVEKQGQRQRVDIVRDTIPSGLSREITIQSRARGGSPARTTTSEITETIVRSGRRTSPIVMTQEQIMEHHLGRNSANLEEIADELQTQISHGAPSTTIVHAEEQPSSDRFTREVTIESRAGGIRQPIVERHSGTSTREISEQVIEKVVRTPPKVAPKPSREFITESHTQSTVTGGSGGSLKKTGLDSWGGGRSQTTESTTHSERTLQSNLQHGQHTNKNVVIEESGQGLGGRSGTTVTTITEVHRRSGLEPSSKSEVTREVHSSTSGGTMLTRDYDAEDSGSNFLTREITVGGRIGGSQISPSSVTATELSSTRNYIKNKTAGGVTVERKPSREERMKHYGIGAVKDSNIMIQETTITPSEHSSKSTTSISSTSSSTSSSSSSPSTPVRPQSASSLKSGITSSFKMESVLGEKSNAAGGLSSRTISSSSGGLGGSSSAAGGSSSAAGGSSSAAGGSSSAAGGSSSGASSSFSTSSSSFSSTGGSSSAAGGSSSAAGGSSSAAGGSSSVTGGSFSAAGGRFSSAGGSSSLASGSSSSAGGSLSASGGSLSASGGSLSAARGSSSGMGGSSEVQFLPDGKGGTQMRVVRHTETSYVGNNPVHSKSAVVLADSDQGTVSSSKQQGGLSTSFSKSSSASSSSNSAKRGMGHTITVTETKIERHGAPISEEEDGQGALRSIMKKPGSSPLPAKKGIKFAEEVSAGFELTSEMKDACSTYATWLQDSTRVNTKQLNTSVNLIQQDWFKVSSQKLSDPSQVEDFCSSFKEISPELLTQIVNMTDANGNSALHYAVSHCNTEVVNLLLDCGALDVDKQNKAGYTAVMLASLATVTTEPQRQAVGRLFQLGDVNARASQAGQTALMLAVSHGRTDMVGLLLEQGADINVQDDDGSTALMCACEHGHTDLVKLILAHPDCDPTVADNDGSTALSIAMEAGHRDVGVLLYAHVNFKQGSPEARRRFQPFL